MTKGNVVPNSFWKLSGENMENRKCSFCEKEELDQQLILKGKYALMIYPRSPLSFGHLMIITNRHVDFIGDLNDEEVLEIRDMIKKISMEFIDNGEFDGFNLINNNGESANQHMPHIHFHFFLRAENEKYSPLDVLSNKEPKHIMSKEDWQKNIKTIRGKIQSPSRKK